MEKDVLIIRNMVCPRCIEAVTEIFATHGHAGAEVSLGRVRLDAPLTEEARRKISKALKEAGFELLDDPRARMVNEIKRLVIERIRSLNGPQSDTFSRYLSETLHKDFSAISRLFSTVEGMTLERYILKVRTEYVKELLMYDELTLSEIAFRLDYSNTAHLSSQFRKETGMTPTQFKKLSDPERNSLDSL